tara:strand:+ start:1864 stop:2199 length:336 start_codon:yes stop_codon:yes gene_type:complete
MAIENAQLTSTQLDLLTVPASKSYAITTVMVCNSSSSATASFDMHLVKSGQSLSNIETMVVKELTLPPGETFTFDSEKIVLDDGDKLSFVAEPNIGATLTNLVATVSYLEV